MTTQRIIIPRGSIKGDETNVIEIPVHLQGSNVVVAMSKDGDQGQSQNQDDAAADYSGACAPCREEYGYGNNQEQQQKQKVPCPSRSPSQIQSQYTDCSPSSQAPAQACDPVSTETMQKMLMLDQLDIVEADQLIDDLRNYQKTRRRLIYDISNMITLNEQLTH